MPYSSLAPTPDMLSGPRLTGRHPWLMQVAKEAVPAPAVLASCADGEVGAAPLGESVAARLLPAGISWSDADPAEVTR